MFPLVNMEVYIAGVAATMDDFDIWLVALVGGIGQSVGKVPWYEVSRNSMQWGFVRRRMERPEWQRRYAKVKQQSHDRPWLAAALLFTSALVALPPLAITAVLAGQLEVSRVLFHSTIIVGRTLQFAALLSG
ncbi:MAG: VTT domain-containing protein, partial [Actinomycetota bacterium]|nr:VTT domain-containing protein [Actinomycetota bacterium]